MSQSLITFKNVFCVMKWKVLVKHLHWIPNPMEEPVQLLELCELAAFFNGIPFLLDMTVYMKFNKRKFLLAAFSGHWFYLFYLVVIIEKDFVIEESSVKMIRTVTAQRSLRRHDNLNTLWYLGWDLGTGKKKEIWIK